MVYVDDMQKINPSSWTRYKAFNKMTISFKNKNHLSTKVMNNISPWVVCCVYTFTSCASTSSVFILYFTISIYTKKFLFNGYYKNKLLFLLFVIYSDRLSKQHPDTILWMCQLWADTWYILLLCKDYWFVVYGILSMWQSNIYKMHKV